MTTVSEAVAARKSVRAFLPDEIDPALVRDMLNAAARSPSGANVQPWFVDVVTGDGLTRLKTEVQKAIAANPKGDETEYPIYPPNIREPYKSRQRKVAFDMYGLLGIAREDKMGRVAQAARNFVFFDAPVGLFFSIDRDMALNQWAHLGMFMQTLALLAVEKGLSTCMQESWASYYKAVSAFLNLPEERMFYCGMALGYEDKEAPVNQLRTERAECSEFATFHTS